MRCHLGRTLALTLLLATSTTAQDGDGVPPSTTSRLQAYAALPPEQRANVVRAILRRMQREPNDAVQRVVGRERGLATYPKPAAPAWFEPKVFAPVAPARTLVRRGDGRHQTATNGMAAPAFLRDLRRAVDFDWATGKAVRVGAEPDDDTTFANLAHGYLPATDHAVAQILEVLDDDPRQRQLAQWFEHLYADRNGLVFEGVTMFGAWSSGRKLEMPDVDIIAFARAILRTDSFVSPIPDGRRRDRIYRQIQDAFAEHRAARSLRLALAAAFVHGQPDLEPAWTPLLPRCQYLWARHAFDPIALQKALAGGDRSRFLDETDRVLRDDPSARALQEQARIQLQDVQTWISGLIDGELAKVSGK